MTTELRAVFDTNVIVSAVLLPQSAPRQAFNLVLATGRILLSEAVLEELDDVLRRPKYDKYVSEQRRLEFLLALVSQAEAVPISARIGACRDPKDDKFLELAVSGEASYIVSGDADLLVLNPFQGVAIIAPREFLMIART